MEEEKLYKLILDKNGGLFTRVKMLAWVVCLTHNNQSLTNIAKIKT